VVAESEDPRLKGKSASRLPRMLSGEQSARDLTDATCRQVSAGFSWH
jgi:hypothetical protein